MLKLWGKKNIWTIHLKKVHYIVTMVTGWLFEVLWYTIFSLVDDPVSSGQVMKTKRIHCNVVCGYMYIVLQYILLTTLLLSITSVCVRSILMKTKLIVFPQIYFTTQSLIFAWHWTVLFLKVSLYSDMNNYIDKYNLNNCHYPMNSDHPVRGYTVAITKRLPTVT